MIKWRKSTRSGKLGNCVEIARLRTETVGVRDSKRPNGAVLAVPGAEFAVLVAGIKAGEFTNI